MSYDVNVGRTQSMINPATGMANNGGSGGNLGFMSQNKKKKQQNSIFDAQNGQISDLRGANSSNSRFNSVNIHKIRNSFLFKVYILLKKIFKWKN